MKARMRIRNLIDDSHRKAIQWLCSNYHVILLPKYETQNKTKKGKRGIGKKTASSMYIHLEPLQIQTKIDKQSQTIS